MLTIAGEFHERTHGVNPRIMLSIMFGHFLTYLVAASAMPVQDMHHLLPVLIPGALLFGGFLTDGDCSHVKTVRSSR